MTVIEGSVEMCIRDRVCAQAMDTLGLPRANILAVTRPGFATSSRTLQQARQLMAVVGCKDVKEIRT